MNKRGILFANHGFHLIMWPPNTIEKEKSAGTLRKWLDQQCACLLFAYQRSRPQQ
jgi:hypothetical protein